MIDRLKNNKGLIILSSLMGSVVIISNYLVQFPFKHFNLNEVLTYVAFTYPISFLITDVSNQKFGNKGAKKVVYFGFFVGVAISIILSLKHFDLISSRIGVASGIAFLLAQLLDV